METPLMPICRERLKQTYSEGYAKTLYNEVRSMGDFMGFAQSFIFDEDYLVARNALWVLTKATDAEIAPLQSILHELIDLALKADNCSVRRLSLNVIIRLQLTEEDLRTDFLDYCMDRMVDVNEYPGIQSLCMKLAFRMCQFYPELHEELMRILEGMEISYYKPAVKSVRNRILSHKKI